MKPHVKNLRCFKQVADVIGESRAQIELFKVLTYSDPDDLDFDDDQVYFDMVFIWCVTPQGHDFWSDINAGINPYEQ